MRIRNWPIIATYYYYVWFNIEEIRYQLICRKSKLQNWHFNEYSQDQFSRKLIGIVLNKSKPSAGDLFEIKVYQTWEYKRNWRLICCHQMFDWLVTFWSHAHV